MSAKEILVFYVILVSAAALKSESCQAEKQLKKQYFVYNTALNFMEAWRECQRLGQRFATITSCQDSALVQAAVAKSSNPKGPWYIGGTDEGREANFIWIATNEPILYENFADGQPSPNVTFAKAENCLEIGRWGGVEWNDVPCDWKQRFICESFV